LIAKLYSEGKTESEIISLTENRRAYVHNVILRLQHPEDFIIEPSKVKSTTKLCVICHVDITGLKRNKYCVSCRHEQKLASWRKHRAKLDMEKIEQVPVSNQTCKLCQKEFKAHPSNNRIYCSKSCYFADPTRKKISKNPDKWQTIACRTCGKEFTAHLCMKRVYCSMTCFAKSIPLRFEKWRLEGKFWKAVICKRCGKQFYRHPSRLGLYCGKECFHAYQHEFGVEKKIAMRVCKRCHKTFEGGQWFRYCRPCAKLSNDEAKIRYMERQRDFRICPNCNGKVRGHLLMKYCDATCRMQYFAKTYHKTKEGRERMNEAQRRWRAKKQAERAAQTV